MTSMSAKATGVSALPWWLVLLNGIAGVIIGFLLITSPAGTLVFLIQVIGLYWFISGIFSIVAIFIDSTGWGWNLFSGILGIIAGIVVLNHPLWSAVLLPNVLVLILGIEGLIIGVISVIQGFRGAGWGAIILGALSVVFGIILIGAYGRDPIRTAVTVAWIGGIFALVAGIGGIFAAFRMRK